MICQEDFPAPWNNRDRHFIINISGGKQINPPRKMRLDTVDTETIFAIAGMGLTVAMLNLLLTRSGRDDAALAVSIVGLVAVLFAVVREVSALFELIRTAFSF